MALIYKEKTALKDGIEKKRRHRKLIARVVEGSRKMREGVVILSLLQN